MRLRIFARQCQAVRINIGGMKLGYWPFFLQRNGDDTGTGAEIADLDGCLWRYAQQGLLHQQLGLWAGHKAAWTGAELEGKEFALTEQIGNRRWFEPALHQLLEVLPAILAQLLFGPAVQVAARFFQAMRQQ